MRGVEEVAPTKVVFESLAKIDLHVLQNKKRVKWLISCRGRRPRRPEITNESSCTNNQPVGESLGAPENKRIQKATQLGGFFIEAYTLLNKIKVICEIEPEPKAVAVEMPEADVPDVAIKVPSSNMHTEKYGFQALGCM